MKRHRTFILTVKAIALGTVVSALVPASALAGGPLLSGYGGPGAGAQSILGATLLNGPGGGAGSGSGSSGGSPSAGSARTNGTTSTSTASGSGSAADAHPNRAANGSTLPAGARAGTSASTSHTYLNSASNSFPARPSPAAYESAGTAWFSSADLLLVVLVAGALALIALLTLRLARTQHH
jgi:hypothetical protein